MASYRWTCNACEAVNEPKSTYCSKCGCSATAGSEEIEKHINPEGFKKKKAKKEYIDSLYIYFFIPFVAALYFFSGRYESLLLMLGITLAISFKNIQLLKHIWSDSWARNTMAFFSSALLLLLLARMFIIPDGSELVSWGFFTYFVLNIIQYFYFFKSSRGVAVFDSYYKKANKPLKRDL
ncbi:zinc finger Ran-binding domain-containing protein [Shewanella xiamenensis]|uniref:Zinc finger Ran-binding domain-containing protein n=1 Tax=Shewanella xiamenensis TaxID=332186 RepID=A0ABT6UAQ5_9GAMM|nr:Ran-binding zinc finger domain-containing protein [Shewanella xiamenensis]MDI5831560.1 zinc finger Ran-binding domain-containing protein [Shewanella xiamenensis]